MLVLDDDQGIGELIQIVLSEARLETAIARDGDEALELVVQHKPDLVLFDMHLAGSRPIEHVIGPLMAHLGASVPWLAMSASPQESRAAALGAYGFVAKPFDVDDLLSHIERGLRLADAPPPGRFIEAVAQSPAAYGFAAEPIEPTGHSA